MTDETTEVNSSNPTPTKEISKNAPRDITQQIDESFSVIKNKTIDAFLGGSDHCLKLYIYIFRQAAYSPVPANKLGKDRIPSRLRNKKDLIVQKGEFLTSYLHLSKKLKLHAMKIKRDLGTLIQMGAISTTEHKTYISILITGKVSKSLLEVTDPRQNTKSSTWTTSDQNEVVHLDYLKSSTWTTSPSPKSSTWTTWADPFIIKKDNSIIYNLKERERARMENPIISSSSENEKNAAKLEIDIQDRVNSLESVWAKIDEGGISKDQEKLLTIQTEKLTDEIAQLQKEHGGYENVSPTSLGPVLSVSEVWKSESEKTPGMRQYELPKYKAATEQISDKLGVSEKEIRDVVMYLKSCHDEVLSRTFVYPWQWGDKYGQSNKIYAALSGARAWRKKGRN